MNIFNIAQLFFACEKSLWKKQNISFFSILFEETNTFTWNTNLPLISDQQKQLVFTTLFMTKKVHKFGNIQ